ncbi:MAG: SRPBCC family protein [Pseudomarimonas sp.]
MIRFLELLTAIVIVAILYVVGGVFLPDKRNVDHSIETNHPLRQVFDTVNGFRRFTAWHPLRQHDPRIVYTLAGPKKGVGATLHYASKDALVGSGTWEIIESVQDEYVVIRIDNESYGTNKIARFDLQQNDKTVEITWSYSVEYGWDLRGRYAGLYVARNAGDDIQAGLGNLVGFIATMPNYDYKSVEVAETVVDPQHILYVSTSSARNITAVETAMLAALTAARKAATDNGLYAAGAPRLITTSFGSDKYEFDVAVPVTRTAPVEPAPEAAAEPGTDPAAAAAEPMAETAEVAVDTPAVDVPPAAPKVLEPLEGLTLPENVLQGQSYAGRALTTAYVGHPAALPLIRDMLRSYAAANGEDIQDRAFEEYLTEISETSAEEAQFNVYWPIR